MPWTPASDERATGPGNAALRARREPAKKTDPCAARIEPATVSRFLDALSSLSARCLDSRFSYVISPSTGCLLWSVLCAAV